MILVSCVWIFLKQTNMGDKNGNVFQVYFQMPVKYRHKN